MSRGISAHCLLLVAGEAYPKEGLSCILKAIDTIYKTVSGPGEIRRINVNIAPLTLEELKQLKSANIGTYRLLQETYHRETCQKVHLAGRNKDHGWRVTAMDRATKFSSPNPARIIPSAKISAG